MNYSTHLKQISKKGISYTGVASTQIGITENGTERFFPLFCVITVSSATLLTIAGTMSVGTNSASYNNILVATAMTGLTGLYNMLTMNLTTLVSSIAANTPIFVNVTVGATATSSTFDVYLFGFYQ